MTDILPKFPKILDPVIVHSYRGTIVSMVGGIATIDCDDDVRVQVAVERLRWTGTVWVVVREDAA